MAITSHGGLSGTLSSNRSLSAELTGILSANASLSADLSIPRTLDVVVSRDSYLDFPAIGDSTMIYVDTTANKVYRWDTDSFCYRCVGSDYMDISLIDATF